MGAASAVPAVELRRADRDLPAGRSPSASRPNGIADLRQNFQDRRHERPGKTNPDRVAGTLHADAQVARVKQAHVGSEAVGKRYDVPARPIARRPRSCDLRPASRRLPVSCGRPSTAGPAGRREPSAASGDGSLLVGANPLGHLAATRLLEPIELAALEDAGQHCAGHVEARLVGTARGQRIGPVSQLLGQHRGQGAVAMAG